MTQAETHEFVRRGECTFTARAELALESMRLALACGTSGDIIAERLKSFRQEMVDAHHAWLAIEAELALAEVITDDHAEALLRSIELKAKTSGWNNVCEEVERIKNIRIERIKSPSH